MTNLSDISDTRATTQREDSGTQVQFKENSNFYSTRLRKRTQRFGASANVVTPLLSMLHSLHRLESSIYDTLHTLGVERDSLPPPYGTGSDRKGALSTPVEQPEGDSIGQYVAATLGLSAMHSFEGKVSAVERILCWLESAAGPDDGGPLEASVAKDRRILATMLVSCEGTGQLRIFEDKEIDGSEHQPPERRRRIEEAESSSFTMSDRGEPNEGMSFVGNFDIDTLRRWRKYRKSLGAVLRGMKAFLKSFCSKPVPGGFSCHAKWIEATADEPILSSNVTSPECLKKNCDQMVLMHDALATCQRHVHETVIGLEDSLELYNKEAIVVNKQENQFLHNVELLEKEYNILRELRYRIKKICSLVPR
ncbi:unnamed protein product [Phytomonas sp. EM1]|nr:unnamed protein product [Phytomonas sp. EM1]|eukprot:CCW64301.1 unnamed protein product [Phytomonas sp. isolate EM1]